MKLSRWGVTGNPGRENQDSQHMIDQPRGSFPDRHVDLCLETLDFCLEGAVDHMRHSAPPPVPWPVAEYYCLKSLLHIAFPQNMSLMGLQLQEQPCRSRRELSQGGKKCIAKLIVTKRFVLLAMRFLPQWHCIVRLGRDSDTDSACAMRTACATSETRTL